LDLFVMFVLTALVVLLPTAQALAHAERQSSDPEEGKTLQEPPAHLYINFSEPPTGDAKITVTDGCGDDVVANFDVTDRTIHANLDIGQPGRYRVATQVVSGLDEHETSDEWSFKVSGTKDCGAAAPEDEPADEGVEEDEGVGSLTLLAAGGAVVLIGVAAAIRLRSK
jgi:methionine-rich copper-binding protein CopC